MNSSYVEDADGKPRVVRHEHVSLGIAVDVEKSDGSRTLLVPVVRDADTARLPRLLGRLRGADPQGPLEQAQPRRLRRHHRQPHQPGHDRHAAVGAAPHAGPGPHRRRRQPRLPHGVEGRRPRHARRPRRLEGHHDQLHLRPPHHPGRRVGAVPQAGRGAAARRRRLLRRGVPRPRRALRGGAVAPRRQPDRPRAGDAREADGGRQPHPRPPRARPPHRRPRPAALEGARHAGRARPGHLRAHASGTSTASSSPAGSAGRERMALGDILHVLRDAYCRTIGIEYMHIQDPEEQRWIQEQVGGRVARARPRRPALHPRAPQRRRGLREVPRHQVRRPEAVRARGRRGRHPDPRRHPRGGRRRRARRLGDRHAAPRPAQRAHQHRRQELRPDLQGVRGPGRPRLDAGLRRREVPPRPGRQVRRPVRQGHHGRAGRQPEPPRGGRPRRRRHGPRQAGRHQRPRGVLGAADPHARRRRLRRPGRGGRDAQHERHQGLPRRRHDPRRRQQPDRLHHHARVGPLRLLLHRRRQDHPGADLPRERRRPRGVRAGGPAGVRVPAAVPQGRRDRHGLLPAPRPQRGRRPELHAAADVRQDRRSAARCGSCSPSRS